LKKYLYPLFLSWDDIKASLKLFGLIIAGGIFLFPPSIYFSLQTMDDYRQNVRSHIKLLQIIYIQIKGHSLQFLSKESQG